MTTYGIDFTNGATVITSDWDAMAQHIHDGDVIMVIVRESGEILYDAHERWDIVTNCPPRVA